MHTYQIFPNYTYADYLLWEGRWEIIQGIAYAMSPMPSPRHQRIAGKLHSVILDVLKVKNKCNCQVYQPIDLKINEHTVVNPDLLIVCRPIIKQFLDFPPVLVVEILSPSTEMKDRNTKYQLYQSFGISYYLIIDPEKETMEIYQLNDEKKYQLMADTHSLLKLNSECSITPKWDQVLID